MSKKKFDLDAYKKHRKIADTPRKKDKYVVLDECLQSVLGMPGIPLGHITQVFGLSDSGKTSLLFHTAAQAQAQDILPVLIVTEGKVSFDRARSMGFDPDNAIIYEDISTLEAGFKQLDEVLADVEMGELPKDVMIFWDSIGATPSEKEFEINKDGTTEKKSSMMVAARVISEHMRTITAKVNNSRKISHPHSAGLMFINHAYTEPPMGGYGQPKLVPSGGKKIWYSSSLVLKTKKKSTLAAIKDGRRIKFGIVSQIQVDKNHITNVSYAGDFVITSNAIVPNEPKAIKEYKEANKSTWEGATLSEED